MPFSWVRVSSKTSPKVNLCMGSDSSRQRFEACVRKIVEDDKGRVKALLFEQNGRYARVWIDCDTEQIKARILIDLEAEEVIDLLTTAELDVLESQQSAGWTNGA
jgi:hypothetical protein